MNQPLKPSLFYSLLALVISVSSFFVLWYNGQVDFEQVVFYTTNPVKTAAEIVKQAPLRPKQVETPEQVRGIYLTASSAAREDYRRSVIGQMARGHINSAVIDIKDSYGRVLYPSNLDMVRKAGALVPVMSEVEKIIDDFHAAGLYAIARLVVFQDLRLAQSRPDLALKTFNNNIWYNYNGLAFTDPQSTEVWNYNLAIAKEASQLGFDEINFDYIRYPSDGPLKSLDYNLPEGKAKADVLTGFFSHLNSQLSGITKTSADLFGLVMDNAKTGYDLGIGQLLVDSADYFDYVSPMMYASHYHSGYLGFDNPALYPGTVIAYGLKVASPFLEGRKATVRPWLQAFSLGAVYGAEIIDIQEEAVKSSTSTSGWLLWNARNYYPDHIFE
ncbi:MAG TPA: putative glycoside hydrolase [Patescibacteria group bacterium]|nr:putative glycoside hydrolase [Patescibacteria group bacterium]